MPCCPHMTKLALVLALMPISVALADRPERPAPGSYVFIKRFELKGCAQYDGSNGIAPHCLKEETKVFAVGDPLAVSEFFWDSRTKTWGAKYEFLGQFRSIPMDNLGPAPKAKPPAR
jgi:hypothetical protein